MTPQQVANTLVNSFRHIHEHSMRGIPLLNPNIGIEAVGFHEHEGRILGIIICPWLMNLVMLPAENEDWSGMELGHKQPHEFANRRYKFMINEYEGIGLCQTHSLHSPMRAFASHEQARAAAQCFMDELYEMQTLGEEDLVDEELLGRVLREEDMDDLDTASEALAENQPSPTLGMTTVGQQATGVSVREISRRDLLRGRFGA
jgi:[NiFe] hydrogenase assembly HybE family chaperone